MLITINTFPLTTVQTQCTSTQPCSSIFMKWKMAVPPRAPVSDMVLTTQSSLITHGEVMLSSLTYRYISCETDYVTLKSYLDLQCVGLYNFQIMVWIYTCNGFIAAC